MRALTVATVVAALAVGADEAGIGTRGWSPDRGAVAAHDSVRSTETRRSVSRHPGAVTLRRSETLRATPERPPAVRAPRVRGGDVIAIDSRLRGKTAAQLISRYGSLAAALEVAAGPSAARATLAEETSIFGKPDLGANEFVAYGYAVMTVTHLLAQRASLRTFHLYAGGGAGRSLFRGVVYNVDEDGNPTGVVAVGSETFIPGGAAPAWRVSSFGGEVLAPGRYAIGVMVWAPRSMTGLRSDTAPAGTLDQAHVVPYPTPPNPFYEHGDIGSSPQDLTMYVTYAVVAGEDGEEPQGFPRHGYCLGGVFVDLLKGQPASDPRYHGATPALFVEGKGITCDPPPPGYVLVGLYDGVEADHGFYPYFRKP